MAKVGKDESFVDAEPSSRKESGVLGLGDEGDNDGDPGGVG